MGHLIKLGAAALLSLTVTGSAFAVDQDVTFRGTILESCSLVIGTDGTLGVSTDQTVLSSEETGGIFGTVTAATNGLGATIEVITPTGFQTGPSSADTNTVFAADYDLSGATVLTEILGGVLTPLGLGATLITVNASATKTSGTFDAGIYELVTVVRCTS